MKTKDILRTTANKYRRKIVVTEINILRKFESKQLIEDKITREMSKLHSLWFRDRVWRPYSTLPLENIMVNII